MRISLLLLASSLLSLPTPVNLDPTQDAAYPSLDIDRQGRAVVAWVERSGGVYKAYVRRWEGTGWRRLGGALNREDAWNASYALVRIGPDGQPVVAWTEKNPVSQGKLLGNGKLYAARWDGQAWRMLGGSPSQSPLTLSDIPRMALDPQGNPYLQWSEMPPDFNGDSVYVKRWTGSEWQMVDNGSLSTDISSSSRSRDIAVDSQGQAVLAWSVQLYREGEGPLGFNVYAGTWNGERWVPFGSSLNADPYSYAAGVSIAIDRQDRPVVAYHEAGGGKGYNVYVKRWEGGRWVPFGQSVNALSGGGAQPKVALDARGNPVVGWLENTGRLELRVARWDGKGWVRLGPAVSTNEAAAFSLAIGSDDQPLVAWHEGREGQRRVFVAHWNGRAWAGLGGN
ncbi:MULTISPECIES: hypothetical protein [unclassified Meiothermus]|uniref:hypothetical protein n=1 Tax=unclassified Meiothermus TaxID=370471 RepID=UPI000D7C6870|nr:MULTISPECIES: hypothetical protein [unclassified Meiothermus]PZA07654.1 hypothetical protein DNA98_04875 [Meiothermus sp. Pnk-1]RYM36490.1 hypothetical protein EWH23_09775 [Meiothermus sp. PNK-Is4]